MSGGPGSLGQQRSEALDPPVDGDVVDLDAAFGEEFLDVAVGQTEAEVPADRQGRSHRVGSRSRRTQTVRWERVGGGRFSWRQSPLGARSQQMQQRHRLYRRDLLGGLVHEYRQAA